MATILISINGFHLQSDGQLFFQNAVGSSRLIDGQPVLSIASAGPTSVFDLRQSGELILLNADGSLCLIHGQPVLSIASVGPTSVFDLRQSGELILLNAHGSSRLIDGQPVLSIASAGPDERVRPAAKRLAHPAQRRRLVAPDRQAAGEGHRHAGAASVFDLRQNGELILLNADGSSPLIDGQPVLSIASAGPTSVFDLRRNGSLILLNANGSSHQIDGEPVKAIVSPAPPACSTCGKVAS